MHLMDVVNSCHHHLSIPMTLDPSNVLLVAVPGISPAVSHKSISSPRPLPPPLRQQPARKTVHLFLTVSTQHLQQQFHHHNHHRRYHCHTVVQLVKAQAQVKVQAQVIAQVQFQAHHHHHHSHIYHLLIITLQLLTCF